MDRPELHAMANGTGRSHGNQDASMSDDMTFNENFIGGPTFDEQLTVDGVFSTLRDAADAAYNPPAVHAVLILVFGTTLAELSCVLEAQCQGAHGLVPRRMVVIDSLPYEDMLTRVTRGGWTEQQVKQAIPRSCYFHLTSPFSEDFDFDHPLNREWLSTLFEPALQHLAAKPTAPGCAGTPALGRARIEGNAQDLRDFLSRHLQELIQVRTETLALAPGVRIFVVTTYRGGTGTGASLPGAAVLKSVIGAEGQIHLHAVMPCVYGGDERAVANATATLMETQQFHRKGKDGGVPLKGEHTPLKAPFDTATYTFARNGRIGLSPGDALMQEAAILMAHLRTRTQAAINAQYVDLTDVVRLYDDEGRPMHVRVESALSIRPLQPDVQEYLVFEWVRQELAAILERFEQWRETGTLGRVPLSCG